MVRFVFLKEIDTLDQIQAFLFQISAVLKNDGFNKILGSIYIHINMYWASNQCIRMICKGSCDTEDWSNDC